MTLVKINDLNKSYVTGGERTEVLYGMDLSLKKGEMVMVMGPSGSGKTTLLNLLGGIDGPDSGLLSVNGMELTGLDKKGLNRFRRERIGFIFQFYNLIPTLTALENVELGLESVVKDRKEMKERARKYLEMVGLMDKANSYPQELSGGQQQRVAVARALAKEPVLVLADEPTGNLDEERERSIMEIMKELQHELGITFLIVSHNTRLKRYMDRTLVLRQGKLHEGS
ncbi:MAG: ABC transporter ATP-binding protein [Thermoplasmatota archaeon]